jgi:hypothetical protein
VRSPCIAGRPFAKEVEMSTEQEWMEQERDEADQVQIALEYLQEVEASSEAPDKEYRLWQASVGLNSAETTQQIGKLSRRVASLEDGQATVEKLAVLLEQMNEAAAATTARDE